MVTNSTPLFPPATTPLLLDQKDFHPRPPKSGKNVVFMDGHVAPLAISARQTSGTRSPASPVPNRVERANQ